MRTIGAGALLFASLSAAAPVATLDVQITGLRSARGLVRICVTADPKNFPRCIDDRNAVRRSLPAGETATRFGGLPPGDYAVAVIHDENSNARLDTMAGIPREGYGFSRNPRIWFGPPRFDAAEFRLGTAAETQQVRMHYFL